MSSSEDLSKNCEGFLKRIKDVTKYFESKVKDHEEKLEKLGLTTQDIAKIKQKSGLDNAVAEALKHNVVDELISGRGLILNVTNSVLEGLKEKSIENEVTKSIFTLDHLIIDLKSNSEFLERELKNIKEKDAVNKENEISDINDLKNKIYVYEEKIKKLVDNSEFDEESEHNKICIGKQIKQLDEEINKTTNEIKIVTKELKKYENIPPNILLTKNLIKESIQKSKELEEKITNATS